MNLRWVGDIIWPLWGLDMDFCHENSEKWGSFLRDGIASGRGVHRKMGVLIQKTRSNFGVKSGKLPKIGISGVGVV